jgi:cytidine deaminase
MPNVGPAVIDDRLRRLLLAEARVARRRAHARYSGFQVGAAVLDERGRIHVGCNVENASYGLTICAERNAVAAAVVRGARRIRAVAVITGARPPASPCGACRQVLMEFGDDDMLVMLAAPRGAATDKRLGVLLPESFAIERRYLPAPPGR